MYLLVLLSIPLLLLFSAYQSWRRNLAKCQESGLDTIISSPFHVGSALWQVSCIFMLPLCGMLPQAWTEPWLDLAHPYWQIYRRHATGFSRCGDLLLVASPGGTYLGASNAEVIHQMCVRRADFPKPTQVYKIIELFGANVVTTEGQTWRLHRKLTAPAFSERNNAVVWKETDRQVQRMMATWAARKGNTTNDMRVPDMQPDAGTLSLHIISRAGFGVPLYWPGEAVEVSPDDGLAALSANTTPATHLMTFKDALSHTLDNFLWFLAFPPPVMKFLPFRKMRKVWQGWNELNRYWAQLLEQKMRDIRAGDSETTSMDLMMRLVEGAGIADSKEGDMTRGTSRGASALTAQDVIANTFVMMFAGHDTVANSLHFATLGLAVNRTAQRLLQRDLDAMLGTQRVGECRYEEWCDRLLNSMLGAVIYEQLRVYSPVINFPKHVATGDQVVMRDGQQIKIPNGTFIHLSNYTIHRDPRYYPHQPSSRTGASHDLQDFVPQRWLLPESHPDKARSRLYTPPPGAFIPFSDGQRACLGRRFAMVELTAALAAIFQHYSVELAVDQWASDEEVASLSPAERRALHQRAIDSAYEKLDDGWDVVVTTKLKKGSEIPIRFVRRGMERFRFD